MSACPECGRKSGKTIHAFVKGYGHVRSASVRECTRCSVLWLEPREFVGVVE